jgi:hypothetical protein
MAKCHKCGAETELHSRGIPIDVVWENKTVMMFTIDLRQRGEPIDGGASATSA